MKKLILSLSLTTAFISASFAQGYEVVDAGPAPRIDAQRLRFGAYFAPNVSWMKPTAGKSDDGLYKVTSGGSKVGYTWGLLMDYYFTENYGIATGFQVNTTGGTIVSNRIVNDGTPSTVYATDFNYGLQYLEVPFALKLRSYELEETGVQVFGQIGVTAGINIAKKASYTVNYNDANGNGAQMTGDKEKLLGSFSIAPMLFQLNVGGGIERPISERMSIYLGVFFNNGFAPDVTDPGKYDLGYPGDFSDGHVRLNSFSFRFGLFF